MNKNTFFLDMNLRCLCAFFLFFFLLLPASPSYSQVTKRIYFVGNSITETLNFNGLTELVESRGNTHIWGRHIIHGASLEWLWLHPNNGYTKAPYSYPNNAFVNYVWDAISLEPFYRLLGNDLEIIDNYINLAKPQSPSFKLFLYSRWPRTPYGRSPKDSRLTAKVWNDLFNRTYTGKWDGSNESKDYFVKLTKAVRTKFTTISPAYMVPVGQVFQALNNKMAQGQVPGYSSIWDVYTDGIHVNRVGSYIAALTYYSTLYKSDPRGIGVPAVYGLIPAEIVTVIQKTVWDIVRTEPLAGIAKSQIVNPM